MNKNDETPDLLYKLGRLLTLLAQYNEPKWHAYFAEAEELLKIGEVERAKRRIRKAYGGMGSFNDALYFPGAPEGIAKDGFQLREELYALSQPRGVLGFLLRFT